jgi:tetratricopeptide (TPR) repeat protein
LAQEVRKTIGVCCGSLLLSLGTLLPQNRPPRTLQVKVAADTKFYIQDRWHSGAGREIRRAFAHFEGPFGLQFKIKEFVYWSPKSPENTLPHFLNELRQDSGREGWDITIGVISPERISQEPFAMASYFDGYVLVTDLRPKCPLEFLIAHELAHMFGAVDIKERDSIMSMREASYRFDAFTQSVVSLQRDRSFHPSLFPLSADALDDSIELFKERAGLGLEEPGAYLRLAILCSEREDYASAQEACLSLLRLNPGLEGLHSLLGNIYLGQNEDDKALEEMLKELAICPDLPETHCNLALAYSRKGRVNEAAEQYKLALRLDPRFAKAHADLGHLYLKDGVVDQAISECRTALRICPENLEALCTLAAALLFISDPARLFDLSAPGTEAVRAVGEAVELCQKAISLRADIAGPHSILGVAYVFQKNFPAAEKEFLQAIEISPDSLLAHFHLGLIYFSSGRTEMAAYHLKRIIDLDPSSELGHWILTQVFQAQNCGSVTLRCLRNADLKD